MAAAIVEVAEVAGGYQFTVDQTIEIDGADKRALAACGAYRFYAQKHLLHAQGR